jgi:hypothetical protein
LKRLFLGSSSQLPLEIKATISTLIGLGSFNKPRPQTNNTVS